MSIRKRTWKNGKGEERTAWVCDYTDNAGKRRLKTFDRKKEADQFAATAKVEVREGIHVADSASTTVAKAGKLWVISAQNSALERSTVKQRSTHLEIHIKPFIGELLLSKLTVPVVREFEDRLKREGRSPVMVKKVLTSLGSLLADANERGLATRNPCGTCAAPERGGKDAQSAVRKGKSRSG